MLPLTFALAWVIFFSLALSRPSGMKETFAIRLLGAFIIGLGFATLITGIVWVIFNFFGWPL